MSARFLVSGLCQYSGANAAAILLRRRSLTTLCYHRVLDAGDPCRPSVDPAIVTSLHVFERQMEIISERFAPVTLSETIRWLDGQGSLPPSAVLITFDDGVTDTYTNAFPVMKRLGIPGTVFLATGFIGTFERHWTDVVYEQVSACSGRNAAYREVERLKRTPPDKQIPPCVRNDGVRKTEQTRNLTWAQIEEMAGSAFEFGSHTRSHMILPHERDDAVREELVASSEDMRLRLGLRPTAFAYPDGQFDGRTMRLVAEAGYKCAFTCDEGVAWRGCNPLALPRLLIHDGVCATCGGDFSRAMFLTHLAGTIPWRYRRAAQ